MVGFFIRTFCSRRWLILAGCVVSGVAYAQKPADVAKHLEGISTYNSLDAADMKPWHLKVSYQLFDSKGQPTEPGSVDEWWLAQGSSRIVLTQAGSTSTWVSNSNHSFHSAGSGIIPSPIQLLLEHIVHPVERAGVQGAVPESHERTFGPLKTECIMLSQPLNGVDHLPLALFPTYCVGVGGILRVTWLNTNIAIGDNQVGSFQGHSVAMQVDISAGSVKSITGHVEQLETIAQESVDLSTNGLVASGDRPALVSGGVMSGHILSKATPVYPESAKRAHIGGTVLMHALIGTDGRIQSLRVISSPDGALSAAAMLAVQRWTYSPYTFNGEPTQVDTTITVNFNLSRSSWQ